MENISIQKLRDLIAQNENIGIAVGREATLDDVAASLSFFLALKANNKKVSIASPTEPIVEFSSLVGIDQLRSGFQGGASGDLIVSFPYREGEIEKVSYTIEEGFLNIVVKAGEQGLTFSENDVQFNRGGGTPTLLFIVGTPRLSDLGTLFNPEALKDTTVVNIDNRQENQGFGDLVLVSPKFSSVSEQAASLLFSAGMELDIDTAQNLLSGISFATDNFQDPRTSYVAFEMASELMRRGAVRQKIQMPRTDFRANGSPIAQRQQRPMPSPRPQPQYPFPPRQGQSSPQRSQQSPFQRSQPQPQQQQQRNRQDEIRQALREQAQQQQRSQLDDQQPDEPPSDWLTPKVYKGSTDIS